MTTRVACGNLDDLREILRSQNSDAIADAKIARGTCVTLENRRVLLSAIIESVVLGSGGSACIVEMVGGVVFLRPDKMIEYSTYVALPLSQVPDCIPPGS